jgi:hypothetical protein
MRTLVITATTLLAGICAYGVAVPATAATTTSASAALPVRDGQHDFDFDFGVWRTHIRRTVDPLSGSNRSIELNGTVTVRKVWGGRASLEEIEADGPNGHWQGLSLFLYNPTAHQWSQSFINSKVGDLAAPLVGEFHDGRGELYSMDTVDGKSILVRALWSDIQADSHRYTESYSTDGGSTWVQAFTAELTRIAPAADAAPATVPESLSADEHQFDFQFGTWKEHSRRLMHPLAGASDWVDLKGGSVFSKIWGGRASLAEFKGEGPNGPVELLALRWYSPVRHEWNLDFATPNVGVLGTPGVGVFKEGRIDFYDQETINGKATLVRFSVWGITADTARTEQAFSADGGKSWETNWVNDYTRVKN